MNCLIPLKNLKPLTSPYPRLAIACSGGVDSVVLAYNLVNALKESHDLALFHVHHNQHSRANTALEFTRKLALELGIPFYSKKLKIKKGASEDELRKERRAAFIVLWKEWGTEGSPVVAVAHHEDDQLETVLFRLMRGTHPESLSLLQPKAESDGITWIRPFLKISKKSILESAEKNHFKWIEDPTNKNNIYARNAIRNEIIPLLEKQRPRSSEKILNFFYDLEKFFSESQEKKFTQKETYEAFIKGDAIPLETISFAEVKYCLEKILKKLLQKTTRTHWDQLRKLLESGKTNGEKRKAQFPGGLEVTIHKKTLRQSFTS